jgi:hypothetical protein
MKEDGRNCEIRWHSSSNIITVPKSGICVGMSHASGGKTTRKFGKIILNK